jgi:hypothetical protein
MPAAGAVAAAAADEGHMTGAGIAAVALWRGRQYLRERRFHREYIDPTLAAMSPALGLNESQVRLHVDPSLGNLTPRLAKPLSPTEKWIRERYGEYVEPVVRWAPDRVQRGAWKVQAWARPVTSKRELLRRPGEQLGPRIELTARTPYLTQEQRQLVDAIVKAKIPAGDLVNSWNQVGAQVRVVWTVRKRPPSSVGLKHVLAHLPKLKEWEFYLGQAAGDMPVIVSLKEDSPHISESAASGAGKSVFAQLIAVQVLHRGGSVLILDRKGSHRWAIGVPNVDYCLSPDQMHKALVRVAAMADERNRLSFHEEDGWDPGPRVLVICEELNATIGQLANYWADVREKGDPKKSPAIAALADLLFLGRSAKVNVLAIAQMLTARAIGGPEARENFSIRCLARYTANNWKMLVPEAPMPRASRTLGRWQVVIGGTATEVQVAFLTTNQARALANPGAGLDSALNRNVPGVRDMMTLRDAIDAGVLPWTYEAAKKRLQRGVGAWPATRGKRGNADLFDRGELERWAESAKADVS